MATRCAVLNQTRSPARSTITAFTVHACIDAWLASGEMRYYHAAVKLADAMIALFHDPAAGAFFSTPLPSPPMRRLLVLWPRAASRCRTRPPPPATPPPPQPCCVSNP